MSRKWLLTVVTAIIVIGSIFIVFKKQNTEPLIPQETQPSQQQTPLEEQRETVYEVKQGDSLWGIARRFGVSIEDIAKLNNININNSLQIGDKLRIPVKKEVSLQEQRAVAQTTPVQQGQVYQVKEGDSLWTIARKFGVKIEEIARANGISPDKTLQIGDKLVIPTVSNKQISQSQFPANKKVIAQSGLLYQVKKGDSLWTIASKYGVSAESIAKANNIHLEKTLQIGEKLVIPVRGTSVPVAKSPAKNTLRVAKDGVLLRKGPGTHYSSLAKLSRGTQVVSLGQQGDWQKIALSNGRVGWVRRDMLGLPLAKKSTSSSQKSIASKTTTHTVSAEACSNSVINTALSYQGARYSYGGLSSRGFDCSGFVKYVYQKHGVNLPHNAAAQYSHGKPVSKNELQPGDLVFFRTGRGKGINHVGIYIGNGKFIHASSAGRRVRIDSLNEGYYKARFVGARRIK